MENVLPVLISIPHGGDEIPIELKDHTLLDAKAIFEDGDSLTRLIYDFGNRVQFTEKASVARAFVDLNRAPDDRPPQNPDGVVKTVTVYGDRVYRHGMYPSEDLIRSLIRKYHEPYHKKIADIVESSKVRLGLDCHSMLPEAPITSANPGQHRPLICLSNAGDPLGNPIKGKGSVTCPASMIQRLADCFRASFKLKEYEVRINSPFQGGYLIRSQARQGLPWIQVEINKSLYLQPPWHDPKTRETDPKRISWLQGAILSGLKLFFDRTFRAKASTDRHSK